MSAKSGCQQNEIASQQCFNSKIKSQTKDAASQLWLQANKWLPYKSCCKSGCQPRVAASQRLLLAKKKLLKRPKAISCNNPAPKKNILGFAEYCSSIISPVYLKVQFSNTFRSNCTLVLIKYPNIFFRVLSNRNRLGITSIFKVSLGSILTQKSCYYRSVVKFWYYLNIFDAILTKDKVILSKR